MYPKRLRSANTRSSANTSTTTTTTTAATTEKIEDQEQPIHWVPVKEEGDDEKSQSHPAKITPKRVSFDLTPIYINGDESQMANPSMSTKQGKESTAPFQELLGRRKKSSSPPIKGAGILKNTKSRHHHHNRRHHRLRQNDSDNSNSSTASSWHPRLILRGPREPKYRIVKFRFEGLIICTVNMEIPIC